MANKNLTDLTARTATADSDLLHINSGGTDYKETKGDFCKDIVQYVELSNQSSITSQVDTLAGTVKSPSFYAGKINSYGSGPAAVTGAPVANSGHLLISIYSGSYVRIEFTEVDGQCRSYEKFKHGGTWDSQWTQLPSRAEITSLNSSLMKSSVSFTKHASITGELIQCNKLANVLYISGYFKVSSTVSSGAVLLDFPSISNYVLQYIFIHNASNQVSARLETASNSGHLCIKVSTAISGSEYHYISCAIVL